MFFCNSAAETLLTVTFSRLKLVLVLVAFPGIIFAQINFKPGYVLTLQGDTIKGFIDYREWMSSSEYINLKTTSKAGRKQKIGPSEITLFSGKQTSLIGWTQLLFPLKLKLKI